MVEAMAITHFIAGAQKSLIDELLYIWVGVFKRFLRWQRLNSPEVVSRDVDLHKTIKKIKTLELTQVAQDVAYH